MLTELVHNMLLSTTPGFIGVTLIFLYLALIVVTALKRIAEGDHMHH